MTISEIIIYLVKFQTENGNIQISCHVDFWDSELHYDKETDRVYGSQKNGLK